MKPVAPAASTRLGLSIILVVSAGCLLATQDAFAKFLSAGLPVVVILFLRFSAQTVIFFTIFRGIGHRNVFKTQHPYIHIARAGCMLGASLSIFTALAFLPLATTTVIMFLNPILVTFLSAIFLKEHIGPRRLVAIFIGFSGVLVVINPSVDGLNMAMLLPLGAAFFLAVYVMLTRALRDKTEVIPAMLSVPLLCAVALAPIVPFVWETPTWNQLGVIALMTVVSMCGHACLQFGLRGGSAAVLTPFLYSQVAFAGILSVVAFGDEIGPALAIGSFLIILSGISIWRLEQKRSRASS
jgi:drug/metabolite transporter (DMT)-like permease